jgi:hypothetical protein
VQWRPITFNSWCNWIKVRIRNMGQQRAGYCVEECATVAFPFRVVEEARLKVQYVFVGEQLKAVKARKAEVMLRLKGAATAVGGDGNCRRCQALSAQVDALNRRVAAMQQRAAVVAAAAGQPQRAPRRCRAARAGGRNDDVEPSSDGSVRVVENAP